MISVFKSNQLYDTIKDIGNNDIPNMPDIQVTANGVEKMLRGPRYTKTTKPDGITTRLLKELVSELAPILTVVYNASVSHDTISVDWKKADGVHIYKKGA